MSEINLSETVLEFEVNLEAGFFVRLDKVEQARVLAVAEEDDISVAEAICCMVDDGSLQAERVNLNTSLSTTYGDSDAASSAFLNLKPTRIN